MKTPIRFAPVFKPGDHIVVVDGWEKYIGCTGRVLEIHDTYDAGDRFMYLIEFDHEVNKMKCELFFEWKLELLSDGNEIDISPDSLMGVLNG